MKFHTILADPPWNFDTFSEKGEGRSASQHYQCLSLEDICSFPVQTWADEDCVLFLWVTDTHLEQAFEVIKSWGFQYKTVGFYWMKTVKDRNDFLRPKDFPIGTGYWTRANPEQCLLATQGSPKRLCKGVRRLVLEEDSEIDNWIISPRREHSRKPDEVYDRIETLVPGPYLELFARTKREGWTQLGNELGKF